MTNRTQEDYYLESKRIRNEVLQLAEQGLSSLMELL